MFNVFLKIWASLWFVAIFCLVFAIFIGVFIVLPIWLVFKFLPYSMIVLCLLLALTYKEE